MGRIFKEQTNKQTKIHPNDHFESINQLLSASAASQANMQMTSSLDGFISIVPVCQYASFLSFALKL